MAERKIRFQDREELVVDLPDNTLDPRYSQCTEHHLACMCREALLAEDASEFRSERDMTQRVFNTVLQGHNTFALDGDTFTQCQCTGCEIARQTHQVYRAPWQVRDDRRRRFQ
ncbi:hypothetical protein ACQEU3_47175 [Spirillospora sp. CA-253888]